MSVNKRTIEILDTTDSTNNYAMALARSGLWTPGNACIALEQSEGRGTRGKIWESHKGLNIMMSIMADTSFLSIKNQFYLSTISSLACYDIFSKYAPPGTRIKWPNDIYFNDRKAGGILIENVIKGFNWQYSIIGIGLNINQVNFSNTNTRAISLKQITNNTYDIIQIANEIYDAFFRRLEKLKDVSFKEIISEYNKYLFKKGEITKLRIGSEIIDTMISGISPDGLLETTDATNRKFTFDEVEWIF